MTHQVFICVVYPVLLCFLVCNVMLRCCSQFEKCFSCVSKPREFCLRQLLLLWFLLSCFVLRYARRRQTRRGSVFDRCLFFQTISQKVKNRCIYNTKLDRELFHAESWNPFILGSKSQRSRWQSLCRSSDRTQYCRWLRTYATLGFPSWVFCTLVGAGFF